MAITKTGSAKYSISCGTSGATIHYTVDGSTPSASSPEFTAQQTTYKNLTVKAIAIKSGLVNSEVATETITVVLPTPVLTQSVNGDTATINQTVSYTNYSGVTFQISKDGGTFSTVTFPYTITANGTYKVKAVSAGQNQNSAEASISVTTMKVDTPVITVV